MYNKLSKLIKVITSIGLIFIWLAVIFFLYSDYERTVDTEAEYLRRLSLSVANDAENLLGSLELAMKTFDAWLGSNPNSDPRLDSTLIKMIDTYKDHMKNNVQIRVVSDNGKVFSLPSNDFIPLADISDREHFLIQKNPQTRGFYISMPVVSRVTNTWSLPISYSLKNPRGGITILLAIIELSVWQNMNNNILPGKNSSISLIRSDGIFLARNPFDESFIGKKILDEKTFKKLRSTKKNAEIINTPDSKNITKLISCVTSGNYPVSVAVTRNFNDVLMPWIFNAFKKAVLVLVGTLLILFLCYKILVLLKDLEDSREKLEVAVRHDFLTGLFSRGYFFTRFEEEITRTRRYNHEVALLIADLDLFKDINDTYGHPHGDKVLKETADAIRKSIRDSDIAGRIGGEEFGVLLTEISRSSAFEIAERIRSYVQEINSPHGNVSISIGGAFWNCNKETIYDLFKRADEALYSAKRKGRNMVVLSENLKS